MADKRERALSAINFCERTPEMSNTPATMTEAEFCKVVNISRTTAWSLRKQKKLSHCRVGNKILYTPEQVEQFLAAHSHLASESRRIRAAARR